MTKFFAALGIALIIKQGRIFKEVRSFLISKFPIFQDFFSCLMCIGFWTGLFVGIITEKSLIDLILFSFSCSFFGLIFQTILTFLEKIFLKYFKDIS